MDEADAACRYWRGLGVGCRELNVLLDARIYSLDDLAGRTWLDLIKLRNCGHTMTCRLRSLLLAHGRDLRDGWPYCARSYWRKWASRAGLAPVTVRIRYHLFADAIR